MSQRCIPERLRTRRTQSSADIQAKEFAFDESFLLLLYRYIGRLIKLLEKFSLFPSVTTRGVSKGTRQALCRTACWCRAADSRPQYAHTPRRNAFETPEFAEYNRLGNRQHPPAFAPTFPVPPAPQHPETENSPPLRPRDAAKAHRVPQFQTLQRLKTGSSSVSKSLRIITRL